MDRRMVIALWLSAVTAVVSAVLIAYSPWPLAFAAAVAAAYGWCRWLDTHPES